MKRLVLEYSIIRLKLLFFWMVFLGFSNLLAAGQDETSILNDKYVPIPGTCAEEITVNHPSFQTAIRISSMTHGRDRLWSTQVKWPNKQPVNKGDVLLIEFQMRCVQGNQGVARTQVIFGTQSRPHINTFVMEVVSDQEWKLFRLPFKSTLALEKGDGKISFGCGMAEQKLDIAGVKLYNYGPNKNINDLVSTAGYRGMEDTATWRKQAFQRIEKYRKSDMHVRVVDGKGLPVSNASVHVNMMRNEFVFGAVYSPIAYFKEKEYPADMLKYQDTFLTYFTTATPEAVMSWKGWENKKQREVLEKAMSFLESHHIPIIGFPMVWQSPLAMPEWLQKFQRSRDWNGYIGAWDQHLNEKVRTLKGRVCQYQVINEMVDVNFVPPEKTDSAILGWCRIIQKIDPAARLAVNEHKIIGYGALEAAQTHPWYQEKIGMILKNGIPLKAIGFQCHFQNILTDPERVYAILDTFARFGLDLQVTEFDIDMDDENLQAHYLKDFFIAVYSHPKTVMLQQWGFWEGLHWRPRAALWRRDWTVKPSGVAFHNLVKQMWRTEETLHTDAQGRCGLRGFKGDYEITVASGKRQRKETVKLMGQESKITITLN